MWITQNDLRALTEMWPRRGEMIDASFRGEIFSRQSYPHHPVQNSPGTKHSSGHLCSTKVNSHQRRRQKRAPGMMNTLGCLGGHSQVSRVLKRKTQVSPESRRLPGTRSGRSGAASSLEVHRQVTEMVLRWDLKEPHRRHSRLNMVKYLFLREQRPLNSIFQNVGAFHLQQTKDCTTCLNRKASFTARSRLCVH